MFMFDGSEYVGNPHEIPKVEVEFDWMDEANREYQRRIKIKHHINETDKYNKVLKKLYKISSDVTQDKIIELLMKEFYVGNCYDKERIKRLFEI